MKRFHLKYSVALILVVAVLAASGGCNKKQKLPDGMPAPYPTIITITQDGAPLEGASIAFLPADSSNPWNAGGLTDATGKANIKTRSKYDGVVPGEYKILITKRESDKSNLTMPDQNTDPEGYAKYMRESSAETLASYDLIDPKFGKLSADTETITVSTGTNEKTIDVGKAVRAKH